MIASDLIGQKAPLSEKTAILDFSTYSFPQGKFEELVKLLSSSGLNYFSLVFSKDKLTDEQKKRILSICNGNLCKGMKVLNKDNTPLGEAYTDWTAYNEAKKDRIALNETTACALKKFGENLPPRVIDFGAGTGQETIALLRLGCQQITSIDGDREAVEILRSRGAAFIEEGRLQTYEGPFLHFNCEEQVDLLISSFTWPYRPKEDFGACWKKTVACIKAGGWIAGHFFGKPEIEDPGMSYHTQEEIQQLLEESFNQITISVEKAGEREIYGGEKPPYGLLFHIVAKKV